MKTALGWVILAVVAAALVAMLAYALPALVATGGG